MQSKIKRECYLFLACLGLIIFMSGNSFAQNKKMTCDDWQNRVDSKSRLMLVDFRDKTEDEILYGMNCLLQLEGEKADSNIEGAMRGTVSKLFGATSKEVGALYYVSYLYYQKLDHGAAHFLVSRGEKYNSEKSVCKAYKSYRKWFNEVKKIGLDEARKQKLDPLKDSGVRWY